MRTQFFRGFHNSVILRRRAIAVTPADNTVTYNASVVTHLGETVTHA